MNPSEPRTSFNADEWFDVYRLFFPEATRAEFEREWEEFQMWKADYLWRRSLQ